MSLYSTYWPQVIITKYPDSDGEYDWYRVEQDCMYYGDNPQITIPQGFVTNFASVPKFLFTFFPPHGLSESASIMHDYCYTTNFMIDTLGTKAARYFADDFFYRNLIATKVPKFQAWLMFKAVRWFGKGHWDNKGGRTIKTKKNDNNSNI